MNFYVTIFVIQMHLPSCSSALNSASCWYVHRLQRHHIATICWKKIKQILWSLTAKHSPQTSCNGFLNSSHLVAICAKMSGCQNWTWSAHLMLYSVLRILFFLDAFWHMHPFSRLHPRPQ